MTPEMHFIMLLEQLKGELVEIKDVLGDIRVNTKKRPVGRPKKAAGR